MGRINESNNYNQQLQKQQMDKFSFAKDGNEKLSVSKRKRTKKRTPCSTLLELSMYYSNLSTDPQSVFFELCRSRMDNEFAIDDVFDNLERHLKWNPTMIHSIDTAGKGYNAMHYLLSNPSLTTSHLKIVKLLVTTSVSVQGKTKLKKASSRKSCCTGILSQRTSVHGSLPLHIVCQNINPKNLDVLEYLIQVHPSAVFIQDSINLNLALHYLCIACTEVMVPLEAVLLLVQQWPESCQVANRDGNLPLHLAVQLIGDNRSTQKFLNNSSQWFFEEKDIDTLDDLNLNDVDDNDNEDDDDDDLTDSYHTDDDDQDNLLVNQKSSRSLCFSEDSGSLSNCPLESTYVSYRKEKVEELYQRYQTQLDIVQYLVDVYPDSIHCTNKQGMTPLQLAISTSSTPFTFPTRPGQLRRGPSTSTGPRERNGALTTKSSNNSTTRSNPIITFLRDELQCFDQTKTDCTIRNNVIVVGPSQPPPTSSLWEHSTMRQVENKDSLHKVMDISGRECDDAIIGTAPWKTNNTSASSCGNLGSISNTSFGNRNHGQSSNNMNSYSDHLGGSAEFHSRRGSRSMNGSRRGSVCTTNINTTTCTANNNNRRRLSSQGNNSSCPVAAAWLTLEDASEESEQLITHPSHNPKLSYCTNGNVMDTNCTTVDRQTSKSRPTNMTRKENALLTTTSRNNNKKNNSNINNNNKNDNNNDNNDEESFFFFRSNSSNSSNSSGIFPPNEVCTSRQQRRVSNESVNTYEGLC